MENSKFVGTQRPACSLGMERFREIVREINETHKDTPATDYLNTKRTLYEVYGFGSAAFIKEFDLYFGCEIVAGNHGDLDWITHGMYVVDHNGKINRDFCGEEFMYKSINGNSLVDLNVFKENGYNQHRLFEFYEDAFEYMNHCKTDPTHVANARAREEENAMWNTFDSWDDPYDDDYEETAEYIQQREKDERDRRETVAAIEKAERDSSSLAEVLSKIQARRQQLAGTYMEEVRKADEVAERTELEESGQIDDKGQTTDEPKSFSDAFAEALKLSRSL